MDDYDYLDEVYQGAGGFDVPLGIPIDLPNIDVRDLGLGSIDFGSIFDPTDLGDYLSSFNIADLTDIFDPTDISSLSDLNLSGTFDPTDIGGLTDLDLSGAIDPTDIGGLTDLDLSGTIDPTDISDLTITDLSGSLDPTDISDLDILKTYDGPEQTEAELRSQLGDKLYEELYGPYAGLGYSEKDIEQLKEGTYAGREQTEAQVREQLGDKLYEELYPMGIGNLSSSAYEGLGYTAKDIADLMAGQEGIRETDWSGVIKTDRQGNITQIGDKKFDTGTKPPGREVIKPDDKKDDKGGGKDGGKDDKKDGGKDTVKSFFERILGGGGKDNALLMALLGGLMGLLGRGSGRPSSPGYQGGIPRYTAQRRPGTGTRLIRAAGGGLMDLAAGGRPARYLRGGTDGMADKIKTSIDGKQPARLSHGEFVIPADVVSHLGNGNSDAGADVLYDMMAKVRKARTGNTKQGKQINPRKYTPA